MKIFFLVMASFILGCFLTYQVCTFERIKDEYAYTLKVNNLIFLRINEGLLKSNEDINYLLYAHINRYTTLRLGVLSIFRAELDELFCSAFIMDASEQKLYKEAMKNKELKQYIFKAISFCSL